MKYVDEFRNPQLARRLIDQIRSTVSQPWVLMDVCGGQTHSLLRNGIEAALNDCIELVHGPGCPVCVTSTEAIDFAQALARRPGFMLASFGDMLRVPGSRASLLDVRAWHGQQNDDSTCDQVGHVQIVYSPLDAVELARQNPTTQIVFFGVGFETTVPSTALAILHAEKLGLTNFSVLASHVRVLPAMEALMLNPETRVQGFLAAGHVCTITGFEAYRCFAERFQVPVVVAGFEPLDLLQAILVAVEQLEHGLTTVSNCYARSVRMTGNTRALETVERVYEVADKSWRGFGVISGGGYQIRETYRSFDAEKRFGSYRDLPITAPDMCMGADVLSGRIKPPQCSFFGKQCTTDHPLGAPMVSSEGACAAYMRYQTRDSAASVS
ncbi:MAG: hydrogenase formation protein HypD [Pirellulaceae bacterium]